MWISTFSKRKTFFCPKCWQRFLPKIRYLSQIRSLWKTTKKEIKEKKTNKDEPTTVVYTKMFG
jgi:hypothetical protein